MKVLHHLIALSLLSSSTFAQQKQSLEEYISQNKRYFYELEEQRIDASSDLLRDTWISPITLNYSYGISEAYDTKTTTTKGSISIDQPIFQSGGILFGIRFAEASRLYSQYAAEVAKKKLIKDALSLLMQIKQSEIRIEKQHLLIDNAAINLELKTEQYMSGQIDSSFLDDAIIQKNEVQQVLYDLEASKERLVSQLRVISDVSYAEVTLPSLELIEREEFLLHNISYKLTQMESEKSYYTKNVTFAKYLPQFSLYAGYNFDKTENLNFAGQTLGETSSTRETDYATYGLKISMPLDVNSYDEYEASRLTYLQATTLQKDKKREIEAAYEQVMQNINNFDKKITLSQENEKLYKKLLEDTQKLFDVGYKTEYDVALLENSYKMQHLDIELFEFDRQLELLTLYEMYSNESE